MAHEVSWLSLAGYLLRPGYGWDDDELRIEELWRLRELGIAHRKEARAQIQWWILWRRVCGGLSQDQQSWLFDEALNAVQKKQDGYMEAYRLLSSLERASTEKRTQLGNTLVKQFASGKVSEATAWSFGRLASRVPLYAEAETVLRAEQVEKWFSRLAELDWSRPKYDHLGKAFYLASRCAADPQHDLSEAIRTKVRVKLLACGFTDEELFPLQTYTPLRPADERMLFGESLPLGLRLASEPM